MNSLYLLIPVALIFISIAIAIFFWAVNSGQYEDLSTESRRILFDEDHKQDQMTPDNVDRKQGDSERDV